MLMARARERKAPADQVIDWSASSPASPRLVRLLILESLVTEADKERYAARHGARYLLPQQMVDPDVMTPDGYALSHELLDYLEAPVPWGQELLARLEVRNPVLCRRYVSYLAAKREHGWEARGLPARVMQAIVPGRSVRAIRRDIQRAEEILVDLVHAEHMRQIGLRVVPHPPSEDQDP